MARVPRTDHLAVTHQNDIAWLANERERVTVELGSRLVPRLQSMSRERLIAVLADPANHELPAEVLGYYVAAARAAGATWQQIGDSFGISRQAAHKRFVSYEGRYREACAAQHADRRQGDQHGTTQHRAAPYPALAPGLTARRGHEPDAAIDRMATTPVRMRTKPGLASRAEGD